MSKLFKLKGLYGFFGAEFENRGIEKSDLDWIVCEVLKIKRAEIPAVNEITKQQFFSIIRLSKKRMKGRPIDRIFKKREFYGRNFVLNRKVLSPRAETEVLCECVIKNVGENVSILEIGTGSGAIAVTLKKEVPSFNVTATDVSRGALRLASANADRLNAGIDFIRSFIFDKLKGRKYDVIVSNPPYIPTAELLDLDNEVKKFDPKLALDGGADGLFFYREIIGEARDYLNVGGKIFFEIGRDQSSAVKKLLEKDFCDIMVLKDYSGNDRIVWAKLKEIV